MMQRGYSCLLAWATVAAGSLAAPLTALSASPTLPPPRVGSILEPAAMPVSDQHELLTVHEPTDPGESWPAEHCEQDCPSCGLHAAGEDCIRFYDGWGRVDYLLWWRKGADLPPLVSTGPLDGNNTILFGGESVGGDAESGGRAEIGFWLDGCHYRGVIGRFFALGEERIEFRSDGLTNVARPFIDATLGSPALGMENALTINAPGGPTGNVHVRMTADVLGGDALYRRILYRTSCSRLDFLIGYQTSRIDENLTITQQIVDGGVTIDGVDIFDARNEFHGGQIGLLASRRDCRWSLDVLAKVGLGNMDETVTISGMETRQPPLTTSTGSFLALPTNIGRFQQQEFAAVPELGVDFTYQLNNCLDFTVGYSFIYWSHLLRPGDHIDRTVNGTQTSGGMLNGDPRPQFAFVDGGYWVQGINFGLTMRR